MAKYKIYENGLKLVVNEMKSMLSVSVGILVGAGSALENQDNNGISHFIEHVNFKGTKNLTAYELSDAFDCIGSQVNAFTSKEMTCYYVKSTMSSLERSFELLCDLFLNSTYESEELEKEKGVVTEEINMSSDLPEEVCLDKLSEAYFGNQGLGQTILGPASNVSKFTLRDIKSYKNRYYNADNIVISFAGNVDFDIADKLTEKYFAPFASTDKSEKIDMGSTENNCGIVTLEKDIEQTHLSFGFNGIKYDGEGGDALALVNVILGSGMSSRLFQQVREKLGLCYTIYSYPSGYRYSGTLAIYAGVNPENAKAAYEAIVKVLKEIKGGITDKEFERGKAQIISSFAFGEESTASQMILYGKYLLFTGKIFNPQDKLSAINSLTKNDADKLVELLDFDNFSLSAVGKNADDFS